MKPVEILLKNNAAILVQKAEGFEKIRGIMFQKNFKPLLFEFEFCARMQNSIHSLFCAPFEAVFLDEEKKIVEMRRVNPFSFVRPKRGIKFLLELPIGTIEKFGLFEGEALKF